MTMYYTPKEDRQLAVDRVKDSVIEQHVGRKPTSAEERERIWDAIERVSRR